MLKFIKKLIIMCMCMILSILGFVSFDFFVVGNQYSELYQASINEKMARLREVKEPKIVLVGDSNVSFGFNSEMIEDAMGMPVVNLGLNGSMGNAFHEEMARQCVNEGDIIIICHDDYSDKDNIPDMSLYWASIEKHTELWSLIRKKDIISVVKAYPRYALDSFLLWITKSGNIKKENTCYSRDAFNKYGDVVYRPGEGGAEGEAVFKEGVVKVPQISDECIKRINEFQKYAKEQGADLLIAGYPIGAGEFTPAKEEFVQFQQELEERLNCEVISDYTDYFIPYKHFYNTGLHLTEEGADIRTEQLLEDLQEWIRNK